MIHKNSHRNKKNNYLCNKFVNLLPQNTLKWASLFLLAHFFCTLKKNENNCIFLRQNFGISKNCTIFVIQSNTELLTYKIYRYESTRN